MRGSKPPAWATWMLEHLVLATDKDALAGDLAEEFGHRRSVGWYWRQVLMAIFVGFSKELGRQWRAAGFAMVIEHYQTGRSTQATESSFMQLGPDACAGVKHQQPHGFAAVSQRHHK
jgi:hypothetical protein